MEERNKYGMLSGLIGILLNLFLFAGKLFAGILSKSVAVIADAFNNLSDAGSSVVTLAGFKLAEQKPDKEHPYGHGRIEYIAGLIISAIILIMGFELIKDSVEKIIKPQEVDFSATVVVILLMSIAVKSLMAIGNFILGKKIDSATIKATALDSMSDCIATSVVLITSIIGHYTGYNFDGYAGVVVSLFVFWAGISAARESINPLVGSAPEQDFINKIENIAINFDDNILGVHDMLVHDYGPGRLIVSFHAEVPADGDILVLHDIIDNLEKKISEELKCHVTIHLDPIAVNDPVVQMLKCQAIEAVLSINRTITIHDFRVVEGESHTNLIFDIVVPYEMKETTAEIKYMVQEKIWEYLGENYFTVIDVDRLYGV